MHLPAGHQAGCGCPACGLALREIGEDITEVLDCEPGSFHVVRQVRPMLACSGCKDILQATAPSRPIDRVMSGAGMLAHVLVSKYCDHTLLYRQTQIYARAGLKLHRPTLTDRVPGGALVGATGRGHRTLPAPSLQGPWQRHADPSARWQGAHRPAVGLRRDDCLNGSKAAPAVWFQYSINRKGDLSPPST